MATLLTFKPSFYTGERDLAAIAALINTCRAADGLEARTSVPRLQENFADPQFELGRDLRLWRDVTGALMAVAQLWRTAPMTNLIAHLQFDIHPQARRSDLAAEIVTWAEQQLQQVGQQLNLPTRLHSGCRDSVIERRDRLEALGFLPVRYFFKLQRSLAEPIRVPTLPAGWLCRPINPQQEAAAWVEMFNQSFVDHWNHHPLTLEEYRYYTNHSTYEAALDWVIESPTGELASFCYSEIDPEWNNRLGRL
ncbi:MAG: GNAT family N-acetyltransferase, partial [Leptolyngbyaceae cyanobacterium]